jgi:hypothetical protein
MEMYRRTNTYHMYQRDLGPVMSRPSANARHASSSIAS